jgi:hypothetical protein
MPNNYIECHANNGIGNKALKSPVAIHHNFLNTYHMIPTSLMDKQIDKVVHCCIFVAQVANGWKQSILPFYKYITGVLVAMEVRP